MFPEKYSILVDQAIWGLPPQNMPATPQGRLKWYRQARELLKALPMENSVTWNVEDIIFAGQRTQERIEILERLLELEPSAIETGACFDGPCPTCGGSGKVSVHPVG